MNASNSATAWSGVAAAIEAPPLDGRPLPDLAECEVRAVPAILYPQSVDEVREIVAQAAASGTPLYPISTGRNWGLGSRKPVRDGCVVLDLGGLDRIRELDLKHGYAVIEAGVSQAALAQRLEGTPWFLNVTTSCKDSSIVGNVMERGEGSIRPRMSDLLGMEVVLPSGELLTTGGVGRSESRRYHGLGTGPEVSGLFCQSSFGVVTACVIALIPRTERIDYAFGMFQREALAEVVDTVLQLRRERVLDTTFRLSELPVEPGAKPPLPDFSLLGPLLGRRSSVEEREAVLRAELSRLPGLRSLEFGEVGAMEPGHHLYQRTQFFRGVPSCDLLRARFHVASCDLDGASQTGWTVVATVLPLEGAAVQAALDIVGRTVAPEGLVSRLEVSVVSATTVLLMTAIWFKRDAEGIARMRHAHSALRSGLLAAGFHPARDGIDAICASGTEPGALAQLKAALDPKGILSPGRYV